jgi:energy-coupling factor transporter ATP-binding protein EcfA2
MAERLTIKHITFQYSVAQPKAISDFSVDVEAGTCCAILGPTGAGKSTLLHALAGTLRRHHPESVAAGSIRIGENTFDDLPQQVLFPLTGLVLQDPYVQISGVRETVFDEIMFTLENLEKKPDNPAQLIHSLLRRLGVDHLAGRKPTSLSGGETQRVALAAIMIAEPKILLLDEPTTALDSSAQDKLMRILLSLRGSTTVFLTDAHVDFALAVADQIVVLNQGKAVFRGTTSNFMDACGQFTTLLPLDRWLRVSGQGGPAATPIAHHRAILQRLGVG